MRIEFVSCLVATVGALPLAAPAGAPVSHVGRPLPAVDVEHCLNGPDAPRLEPGSLADHVLVLEFWATWCGPCIGAIPHVNALVDSLEGEQIRFLSITNEPVALIERFTAKREMKGWVCVDADTSYWRALDVRSIPRTIVADRDGQIVMDTHPTNLHLEDLRAVLAGTYAPPPVVAQGGAGALPDIGTFVPGTDPLAYPWIDAGEIDGDAPVHQTIIRPTISTGKGMPYGMRTLPGGGVGITLVGGTTRDVLARVHELPTTHRVEGDAYLDDRWDIVFSRIEGYTLERAWAELAEAFEAVAGTETTREHVERDVWLTTIGPQVTRRDALDRTDPTTRTFQPLRTSLWRLEILAGEIVVAGPEADDHVLDMFGLASSVGSEPDTLRAWLASRGVTFERDRREVEILRVTAGPPSPDLVAVREQAAMAFGRGEHEKAAELYARYTAHAPRNGLAWYRLATARHHLSDYDGAEAAYERARAFPFHAARATYQLACCAARAGEAPRALTLLEEALGFGWTNREHMLTDPDLESVRGHARFTELAARLRD